MKSLALLFALSLYLLPNPTHSKFNPILLPTADVALASDTPVLDTDGNELRSDTPVLDTDGNELRAGETYYITNIGQPGNISIGVELSWLNSTTQCASNVVISRCFTEGDPIRITPADTNAGVVLPSTFQSFAFFVSTSQLCVSSVHWGIQSDLPSRQFFLNSGEFVPNLSDQFKIEVEPRNPGTYRIIYCPFGGNKCYYVSLYYDESAGAARWVLSENSILPVVFKKVRFC